MQDFIEANFKDIFEPELLRELTKVATFKTFDEQETLMNIGQYIQYIPILISGAIKIIREDQKKKVTCYYTILKKVKPALLP